MKNEEKLWISNMTACRNVANYIWISKKSFCLTFSLCKQSECITEISFVKKFVEWNLAPCPIHPECFVGGMNIEWDGAMSKFSKNITVTQEIHSQYAMG